MQKITSFKVTKNFTKNHPGMLSNEFQNIPVISTFLNRENKYVKEKL